MRSFPFFVHTSHSLQAIPSISLPPTIENHTQHAAFKSQCLLPGVSNLPVTSPRDRAVSSIVVCHGRALGLSYAREISHGLEGQRLSYLRENANFNCRVLRLSGTWTELCAREQTYANMSEGYLPSLAVAAERQRPLVRARMSARSNQKRKYQTPAPPTPISTI